MKVTAKPFGTFKPQVSAAQELYGKQLEIKFMLKDVDEILEDLNEYYNEEILNRVRFVIENQLNKC